MILTNGKNHQNRCVSIHFKVLDAKKHLIDEAFDLSCRQHRYNTSFPYRRDFTATSCSGFNLNSLGATTFKSAKAFASTAILVVFALLHEPIGKRARAQERKKSIQKIDSEG